MAIEATVQRIFDDLLNVEVNLILKADMTARKMPMTGEAFADIAGQYSTYLGQQAERLDVAQPARPTSDDDVTAALFDALSRSAKTLRKINVEQPDPEGEHAAADVVLKRIDRNSQELSRIMKVIDLVAVRGQDGIWTPLAITRKEDLLILRKAWEVGTESVIMQTVAQVDGDIFTRLQPAIAAPGNAPLHAVQARLVKTALEQWRFMFATVATFTLDAFRTFFQS